MDLIVYPGKLSGTVNAISSKSQAHRLLICAAFSDGPTLLCCTDTNQDIEATVRCLRSLGAGIQRTETGYAVEPIGQTPQYAELDCGESGSTLRFLLPIVCALGIHATIQMRGRLPYRPLSPLWEELERMGCTLSKPSVSTIVTTGKLKAGQYSVPGNISSQYISGLLFALALVDGQSRICITETLESRSYVTLTQLALLKFGVSTENYWVSGGRPFHSPGNVTVEGDWSNAAFFLVAKEIGNDVSVHNLNYQSPQGDREIIRILQGSDSMQKIDVTDIPDLVPILAVYFATKSGAEFVGIARLRTKESDRVLSVMNLLNALGIQAEADNMTMRVYGGHILGGTVDACNDHRIAMSAAIAATVSHNPITILGADCVAKSYPSFWKEYRRLGGNYEQCIR